MRSLTKRFGMPLLLGCFCVGYLHAQVKPSSRAQPVQTTRVASSSCMRIAPDTTGETAVIVCAVRHRVLLASVMPGVGKAAGLSW